MGQSRFWTSLILWFLNMKAQISSKLISGSFLYLAVLTVLEPLPISNQSAGGNLATLFNLIAGIHVNNQEVNVMSVTKVPSLVTAVDLMELQETAIVLTEKSWICHHTRTNIIAFLIQISDSLISGISWKNDPFSWLSIFSYFFILNLYIHIWIFCK